MRVDRLKLGGEIVGSVSVKRIIKGSQSNEKAQVIRKKRPPNIKKKNLISIGICQFRIVPKTMVPHA